MVMANVDIGWCKDLSIRARNSLLAYGYTSKDQVKADFLRGLITVDRIPTLHQKAVEEISGWIDK